MNSIFLSVFLLLTAITTEGYSDSTERQLRNDKVRSFSLAADVTGKMGGIMETRVFDFALSLSGFVGQRTFSSGVESMTKYDTSFAIDFLYYPLKHSSLFLGVGYETIKEYKLWSTTTMVQPEEVTLTSATSSNDWGAEVKHTRKPRGVIGFNWIFPQGYSYQVSSSLLETMDLSGDYKLRINFYSAVGLAF